MATSHLNIRQMEVIRAVVQAGSMTRAAETLGISQPAISRMIRHAETRSGLVLFHRKGTALEPTPEAWELCKEIERIFVNVERTQRLAIALKQGWSRIMRIGTIPSLATTILAPSVARLATGQPQAKLILKTLDSNPIEAGVRAGDFDFGVVQGMRHTLNLNVVPLVESVLVCLLPPNHRLAGREAIGPGDLAGEALVSFGRLNPLGMQADRLYETLGVERQVAIQTGNAQLAVELVHQGAGVALSDPFAVEAAQRQGVVVRPLSPRVVVRAVLIYRSDRTLSSMDRQFVTLLRERAAAWSDRTRHLLAAEPALLTLHDEVC